MNLLNKILTYCARDITKGYYASDIAKQLKLNQKTVSNHLNRLEKKQLLKSRTEGRNKLFSFNTKDTAFPLFLISIETNKTLDFLKDHFKIKETIKKIDNMIQGNYLIFGSYAKGLEKKQSDLDLFIVGDYDDKKIRELSKLYGIEIQAQSIPKEEFIKAVQEHHIMINEIVKDHIIIRGIDFFTDMIIKDYHLI